jgi:hypothetical protein
MLVRYDCNRYGLDGRSDDNLMMVIEGAVTEIMSVGRHENYVLDGGWKDCSFLSTGPER